MRTAFGLFLGFLVLCLTQPSDAHAQDKAVPSQQCDGSTLDMVKCLDVFTRGWDKRLNAAYQEALAFDDRKDALRAAQRLWVQYRHANCHYYGIGQGTIAAIDSAECMRRMTARRALELEQITQVH